MIGLRICNLAQAVKGDDVLVKGIEDRSVAEQIKHILDRVLLCQCCS